MWWLLDDLMRLQQKYVKKINIWMVRSFCMIFILNRAIIKEIKITILYLWKRKNWNNIKECKYGL